MRGYIVYFTEQKNAETLLKKLHGGGVRDAKKGAAMDDTHLLFYYQKDIRNCFRKRFAGTR